MKNPLFDPLKDFSLWQEALDAVGRRLNVALYDMTESQRAFFVCALSVHTGRQVLFIAPSQQAAQRAADDCAAAALLTPPETQFVHGAASRDNRWQRMMTLQKALSGNARVLCATAEALLSRYPSPHDARERAITLRKGGEMDPQTLGRTLASWGYERVDMVEGKGQYALRGDILDVYPPTDERAIRIEFFDREIDSIRPFDAVTQRSEDRMDTCSLTAAAEYLVPPSDREAAAGTMENILKRAMHTRPAIADKRTLSPDDDKAAGPAVGLMLGYSRLMRDSEELKDRGTFEGMYLWSHLLMDNTAPLEEWLNDPIIVLDTPERCITRCEDRLSGFYEDLKQALAREEAVGDQADLLYPLDSLRQRLAQAQVMTMQDLLRGMAGMAPDKVIPLKGVSAARYQSRFRQLSDDIKNMAKDGYALAVLTGGAARSERISRALSDFDCPLPLKEERDLSLERGAPVLLPLSFSRGFIMEDAKLALITDTDLYGVRQRKTKRSKGAGERLEAFTELSEGDFVVHEHHGIGVYKGTVRLQSEGAWRDYLFIQYRGTDKLFIPIDQFDRVQKYIGGQGDAPPLNDLGGNDWARQKSKVKSSLQKLAFNLVNLYAERQATPGYAFPPATPWEQQFAENFQYELTGDQEQAVQDVLSDMEKPLNMDRLLCGDVGYGKTEVAMRAAFRAVMSGKQVAMLAPTTILVQQHYSTFRQRFKGFPVEIGAVSRFRSTNENRETLSRMHVGQLDILIGTHRMLSKDVRFKDLGLLIVDEEQRFGVAHKEVIKNLKKTVDVLTLSATPIPRTLHMSMVGVRDMSLLETPPEERYPVQTYVVDYNDGIIRDAVMRELSRGGQVFFVYNRVQSIDAFGARLRNLVPEARVAIAHGQMRDSALEDVMMDFAGGKFNVLLCTTIIENGIDIARANTLIVFDADRFGLSQLYQLRGRVGRSSRAAYAYFTVKADKALSETAEKRLAAIKEFTEFGAGFRIAMRDLEIRGAGNIFGPEQSGQVSVIGYDMYVRLIEEAVREAKGDFSLSRDHDLETRVELHVDAYLPESYVSGQTQRIEIYKRISLLRSMEDKMQLTDDLIDRFGDVPDPVVTLIDVARLRAMAAKLGSDLVTFMAPYLTFRLKPDFIADPVLLVKALQQGDKRLTLTGGKKPALLLKVGDVEAAEALAGGIDALESLLKAIAALSL